MAHVAIAADEFPHPSLPQHLALVADPGGFVLTPNPQLEPFKKELPFPGHASGIGPPSSILGIHKLGIHGKRHVHITRSSADCGISPGKAVCPGTSFAEPLILQSHLPLRLAETALSKGMIFRQ